MMVPFWVPQILVPCYTKDPKRDHNFDNHPFSFRGHLIRGGFQGPA